MNSRAKEHHARVAGLGADGFERIGEKQERAILAVRLDTEFVPAVEREGQGVVVLEPGLEVRRSRPEDRVTQRPLRPDRAP